MADSKAFERYYKFSALLLSRLAEGNLQRAEARPGIFPEGATILISAKNQSGDTSLGSYQQTCPRQPGKTQRGPMH
jgi:hypothetical protein